ncbi:MAG: Na/Pi cotransporter family protein, partial [Deltaproteobacteria bacterium]|nr:Na/Pi cotransporter family protein [Deltaproteobacteria bacterium]
MTSLTLLTFVGAILILLYGMRLLGDGLQRAAGPRLRSFLLTATDNRFKGVFVGAVITALLQSSSATTVMLVGFVGSGVMGISQTMGVILGADIGTTITVQIIAFKIYDYAVPVVGLGIFMRMISKSGPFHCAGTSLLGLGLVFLALQIIIDTFAPLAKGTVVSEVLISVSSDPLLGIIISAVLTALFQSSAATLGLAIGLAYSGLLTLDSAMPIVLGANIGTCATALIASIGARVDAKRVALAHILFKVAGVIIVLPFLGFFTDLVVASSSDMARQVALAHTFFNIAIAVLFLPFTGPFTKLVKYLLPVRLEPERFSTKYLDPIVLNSPALALGQATRETLRLADIVQLMLKDSLNVLKYGDKALLEDLEERDNDVDFLDREIKLYLTKLTRESLGKNQAEREFEIFTFSNNLENIGDVIDNVLMDLARKKIDRNLSFSKKGMEEIELLHKKIMENFDEGVATFTSSDPELARRLLLHKSKIGSLEH